MLVAICPHCFKSSIKPAEGVYPCELCGGDLYLAKELDARSWAYMSAEQRNTTMERVISGLREFEEIQQVRRVEQQRQKEAQERREELERTRENLGDIKRRTGELVSRAALWQEDYKLKRKTDFLTGADFLMTTGQTFEGYEVLDYLDIVSATVILAYEKNGQDAEFGAAYDRAGKEVAEQLREAAVNVGANGILALQKELVSLPDGKVAVVATGTAVLLGICP